MPLFSLAKQRLDPDLPFAHGLFIRFSLTVAGGSVQKRLKKRAVQAAPTLAVGTPRSHGTGVADSRRSPVDEVLHAVIVRAKGEFLPLWAKIDIPIR